ncbi:hypothetical protein M0R72_10630 [Candidatus Pacearchaeota archaeon]|jgi:predicted SprT family Zn-dependent metalloprotease|nr:hypothetical protein [Candidatus Pacearchaeota archaeon]
MNTAKEKNDASRTSLTEAELQAIADKYLAGTIAFVRRGPVVCACGDEMWMRFIGHRDEVAEWEYRCEKCGERLLG